MGELWSALKRSALLTLTFSQPLPIQVKALIFAVTVSIRFVFTALN